jgi:hypothetical protein
LALTHLDSDPYLDNWGIHFNMLRPGGLSMQCTVTRGALDELVEGYGETTMSGQITIFAQWRAAIERVASHNYDAGKLDAHGMVVVGPDDVEAIRCARSK